MAITRIDWDQLPADARNAVKALLGPVAAATTVGDGQNSAIAAVLDTAQGRVFLKGLRTDTRAVVTQQREAAINPHVRAVAPEMRWRIEIAGWDLLCFDHVDGRAADYRPGSPDLPRLVAAIRTLAELPCPNVSPVYFRLAERRWADEIGDPAACEALTGDTILHTDYNPTNILVTSRNEIRVIDWAWPTKGAAWIDPACLVPRLIAGGHSPASAEAVARECPSWSNADPAAIDVFAHALTTMWTAIAQAQPEEAWKQSMARAARAWRDHRSAARPAVLV